MKYKRLTTFGELVHTVAVREPKDAFCTVAVEPPI